MELNYLKAFYEVAKTGSFSAAAKRLHTSQSALSRSVALLEDNEGVKLLERTSRGVRLTQTGSEVFQHCEQLFQTVHRISGVCRGIRETCEGPLRFAAADHVMNYLLAEPITAFRREYPAVVPGAYIGTPDEVVALLLNQQCEFGLLFAKVPGPQIEYEALREEPMTLVVQAEIWRESKGGSNAATLSKVIDKVGYISSIDALMGTRPSRVLLELFGKMPRIGFEANGQESQKRVCIAGGGVAYLSRFMVENEIKSGVLHEISVDDPHTFKLWLARRKGHVLSLAANTFLKQLKQRWS